jgi:hypothetical protein
MPSNIKFLGIRLRAFAQSTEVEERVLRAMQFASGIGEIPLTRTEGHFGNPITILELEMTKSGQMNRFLERMRASGILAQLAGQEEARTDESCNFHFRLDKQKAYLEELALATGKDVIDVRLKVAVYPAKRESAVQILKDWLSEQEF